MEYLVGILIWGKKDVYIFLMRGNPLQACHRRGLSALTITLHSTLTKSFFDRTAGGVRRGEHGEVTAPPLLWVKALDMVMDKLIVAGVDFSTVEALSGAGQVSSMIL